MGSIGIGGREAMKRKSSSSARAWLGGYANHHTNRSRRVKRGRANTEKRNN